MAMHFLHYSVASAAASQLHGGGILGEPVENDVSTSSRSDGGGCGCSVRKIPALRFSWKFQSSSATTIRMQATVGRQGSAELALDWKHMACEREEAKAMAVDLLQARGMSGPLATRAVNKSGRLIAHLLSLLRAQYRTRYLSGRELTTPEIRSLILPYLESLGTQYKEGLADAFISFPDPPTAKVPLLGLRPLSNTCTPAPAFGERKIDDYPRLRMHAVDGSLRPSLMYFLELGFPPENVDGLVSRFPTITSYSVEGKIKPVVDLLLGMGVSLSDIPKIVLKRPQLFGCSLEDNIKPTVAFLEGLGVKPERWAKILVAFPHILTYSYGKFENVVKFLTEIGLSTSDSGRVLTRFPHVVGYSVEVKLRPLANYFYSIGVTDLRSLTLRSPQTLGLSLELNIKPTILFFRDLGYTTEELTTIISRFPQILGLNVEGNIRPKWEYFVEMDRLKTELVDFPQYFGYSLEKRIKPRYEAVRSSRVLWTLNRMLSSTDVSFQKNLEKDGKLVALVSAPNVSHFDT